MFSFGDGHNRSLWRVALGFNGVSTRTRAQKHNTRCTKPTHAAFQHLSPLLPGGRLPAHCAELSTKLGQTQLGFYEKEENGGGERESSRSDLGDGFGRYTG